MFHIIEDDPMARSACEMLIASTGYPAKSFASAVDYLAFVDSRGYRPPVAILTDVAMSHLSGVDLVISIRNLLPEQRFAIITGWPHDRSLDAVRGHVCHVLPKPFMPSALLDLVRALHACDQARARVGFRFPRRCEFGLDCDCPLHGNGATCAATTSED